MSESRTENATGVFVLGMHRSGTSAITRVINVLGFEVGDNLMPSKPDNSKGFWEDWDVVHLNEQILRSGGESWDSPSLFDTKDLSSDRHERYIQLASELLQRKFNNIPRFVIKDPRISLLMPIWVEACERLQINLSYVLCLRHPASVASSLASRNAMALDQALLLWLNHLYSILRDCPAPLLVVGYENLLSDTRNELRRVAEFLDVSNLSVVTDIEDKILDKTLDHFPVERLANCGWLALVDEVYHALCQHQEGPPISSEQQTELLASFALDDLLLTELNRSALTAKREQVQKQKVDAVIEENHSLITSLERIRSRLPYLEADGVKAAAELSELKSQLVAVKADRDNVDSDRTRIDIERIKLLDINRLVVEDKQRLEQEFGALKQELGASKQEFGALKQELDVLQQELARLSSVEEEKDEFRAQYTLLQSDYESKIDELNEKAAELLNIQDLSNDATAQLNDAKDELDDTRDRLNGATTEIVNLRNSYERISNELHLMRESRSWKMTTPLRWVSNRIYRIPGVNFSLQHRRIQLQPFSGLARNRDNSWTAIDHDPQFLLRNIRYPIQPGTYEIRLRVEDHDALLAPCLYIDYSTGFLEEDSVMLSVSTDSARAVVTFTDPVHQLRLDPCERMGTFRITKVRWRPLSKAERTIHLVRHVIRKYRGRGLTFGEIIRNGIGKARREGWGNVLRNTERIYSSETEEAGELLTYDKWVRKYEEAYRTLRYGDVNQPLPDCKLPVVVINDAADGKAAKLTIDSLDTQHTAFEPILLLSSCDMTNVTFQVENIQYCHQSSQFSDRIDKFVDSLSKDHVVVVRAGNVFSSCFSRALAISLSMNPAASLIYTDNDTLTGQVQRVDPEFKPDWSPDFELESHYIGDTFVISVELLKQIPPLWVSLKEDTLYALIVSTLPFIKAKDVEHIPEVLWHKSDSKPGPVNVEQIQAILGGLKGPHPVTAIETDKNSRGYRIQYDLPKIEPLVDIIIPTKDKHHLLKMCIDSILSKTLYGNYRIVVVDNGSTEVNTLQYLDELRSTVQCSVLPYPEPFNYSAINNIAVHQSAADIVVLMNNDIEVISPEWLREMVAHAIRPAVGCVGAKLYYPDGRIQHAGVVLGIHGVAAHVFRLLSREAKGYLGRLQYVQNYSAVTGACLAVRREIYQEVGGLNDRYLAVDFNDIDFCLKVREAGYRNIWTPHAEFYHHESATRGANEAKADLVGFSREAAYMTQRWGKLFVDDPAYNPNLSLSATDLSLSTRHVGGVSLPLDDAPASISEHPYRVESNINRVNQLLKLPKTSVRVRQKFEPGLSIIILTLEKLELIEPLLDALVSTKRQFAESNELKLQIIVGDTGSQDVAVHALYRRLEGEVTVVKDMKYHFSRCNNELFHQHAIYDAVLFLNNDIIFSDPVCTIRTMYTQLKKDGDVAIVGTYLLYPNKRLQHGGIALFDEGDLKGLCYHPGHNTDFTPPDDFEITEVPGVTGACLMMKSSEFLSCDCFDETYEAEAQDVDLCLKAHRIGKKVKLVYCGEVIHHENATRPPGDANQHDRSRFIRKWRTYQEAMGVE